MTKPVVWANLGNIVRDLAWRSHHPHKILHDRSESLASRIARLRRAYDASRYHDVEFHLQVITHLLDGHHPSIHRLGRELVVENDQIFDFPDLPSHSLSAEEVSQLQYVLDDLERRLTNEEAIRQYFLTGIHQIAGALAGLFSNHGQSSLTVPLVTPERVTVVMSYFTTDLMSEDRIKSKAFINTAGKLLDNALALSRMTFEQYEKSPLKITAPHEYDGDPMDYLTGTALQSFFETEVPFTIPRNLWREHGVMFAPSGHGKTQALQALILDFLESDTPALFILDSHGDMLRKLRALDPPGLVVVDPEAHEPPALNFLDFKGNSSDVVELFGYLMSALSADLSGTQSTMAAFILRLMQAIPGATIDTLRQVMEDPAKSVDKSPFAPYIATLDPIAQAYFRNQFYASGSIAVTKSSVARRIYKLLSNPTFARMFAAPTNSFDAFAAMQEKRIVLINTSMQLLRAEASSVFGRFMLAQILSAAYQRVRVPECDRHLALVIVDEAAPYMDETVERILTEARKFGVGLLLATQFVEQIPASVKAAINGNTAIKFAGPVSYGDANAIGREMFTTGEFLRSMRKQDREYTEFACYVRNLTPSAVRVKVPFLRLENAIGDARALINDDPVACESEPEVAMPRSDEQRMNEMSLRDTKLPLPDSKAQTENSSDAPAANTPASAEANIDPAKPTQW